MHLVEGFVGGDELRLVTHQAGEFDFSFVILAQVAHVDCITQLRFTRIALLTQFGQGRGGDLLKLALHQIGCCLIGAKGLRPNLVHAQIGHQQPHRRKGTRKGGHNHGGNVQLTRNRRAMQRTSAAKGKEGKAPRVMAPFNAHHADGVGHIFVGYIDNGVG